MAEVTGRGAADWQTSGHTIGEQHDIDRLGCLDIVAQLGRPQPQVRTRAFAWGPGGQLWTETGKKHVRSVSGSGLNEADNGHVRRVGSGKLSQAGNGHVRHITATFPKLR